MKVASLEDAARSPDFVENPYAAYSRFRDNGDGAPCWAFSHWTYFRHSQVSEILRHNGFGQGAAPTRKVRQSLLHQNPPEHTRLRALLTAAFTPRSVLSLRPRIESIVHELLSAVLDAGSADLVADFAYPLPVRVICELLGVPASDREFFARVAPAISLGADPPHLLSDQDRAARRRGVKELRAYFREVVRERRGRPGDDLVTRLVEANRDGDRLDEADVVASCVLLLVAGHVTTVSFIANSAWTLMRHPDQLATLLAIPPQETSWMEELLRYDAPVQMMSRIAISEFEFEGRPFVPGDRAVVVMGSANRDPAVFERPDELDLLRSPGRQLSFGMGIHFCLGAQLARLEGEVALRAVAPHLTRARIRPDGVRWRRNIVQRGLSALPVMLDCNASSAG